MHDTMWEGASAKAASGASSTNVAMGDGHFDGDDAEAEADSGAVVAIFDGGELGGGAAGQPRCAAGPGAGVDAAGQGALLVVSGQELCALGGQGGAAAWLRARCSC
jgi:hypothetical protein